MGGLEFAPKFSARFGGTFHPRPDLRLSGDVQYVGEYHTTYDNLPEDKVGGEGGWLDKIGDKLSPFDPASVYIAPVKPRKPEAAG